MNKLTPEQCLLIKDFLLGVTSQFYHEDVSLYPILDVLHLLDQRPLVYSFYRWSSLDEPVYTTMQDSELKAKFYKSEIRKVRSDDLINCGEYGMIIHTIPDFDMTDSLDFISNNRNSEIFKAYDYLFELLRRDNKGKEFIEILCNTITKSKFPSSPKDGYFPIKENEVKEWLEPVREVIDNALFDLEKTSLLRKIPELNKDIEFPNLFPVVRTATVSKIRYGFFNYTARLVLSKSQREYLGKSFMDGNIVEHLESELGEKSRSIADSVYCSGVIDFSGEKAGSGRDKSGEGKKDIQRVEAERKIYNAIRPEHRIFYTPIHVNGVSWIALFVLTSKHSTKDSWFHNYQLYRTQIPKIAERIRLGSKSEYIKILITLLSKNFTKYGETKFDEVVNTELKKIAAIYPFGLLNVSSERCLDSMDLLLPNNKNIYLELMDNPYFDRQINYYILHLKEVIESLSRGMHELRRVSLEQYKERIEDQQHIIFNHYDLDELVKIIDRQKHSLPEKARIDLEDYLRKAEIVDIAIRYAFENTSNLGMRMKVNSISGVLRWLERHVPSTAKILPDLRIDTSKDFMLDANSLPIAFTIIWNLWHNASMDYTVDRSTRNFQVTLSSQGSKLLLSFQNEGKMDTKWVNYLLDKSGYPEGNRCAGLRSVKRNMKKISWDFAKIKASSIKTLITIRIPLGGN